MSGDAGLNNGHGNVSLDELPEVGNAAADMGMDGHGVDGGEPQGFLEIVYGVLFEPVKTMRRAADNPPLVTALVIVTILSLLGTLMAMLTFSRILSQSFNGAVLSGALVPVGAFISLVFSYVKWFGYSAVLHLVADLLGGKGAVRGVFTAVGLAVLPNILLFPFQFIGYLYGLGNLAVTVLLLLAGLAVEIWSSVVLVIGIREVYRLSTGRSVLVFFIPFLALFLLLVLSVTAVSLIFSVFPLSTDIPGYF